MTVVKQQCDVRRINGVGTGMTRCSASSDGRMSNGDPFVC